MSQDAGTRRFHCPDAMSSTRYTIPLSAHSVSTTRCHQVWSPCRRAPGARRVTNAGGRCPPRMSSPERTMKSRKKPLRKCVQLSQAGKPDRGVRPRGAVAGVGDEERRGDRDLEQRAGEQHRHAAGDQRRRDDEDEHGDTSLALVRHASTVAAPATAAQPTRRAVCWAISSSSSVGMTSTATARPGARDRTRPGRPRAALASGSSSMPRNSSPRTASRSHLGAVLADAGGEDQRVEPAEHGGVRADVVPDAVQIHLERQAARSSPDVRRVDDLAHVGVTREPEHPARAVQQVVELIDARDPRRGSGGTGWRGRGRRSACP